MIRHTWARKEIKACGAEHIIIDLSEWEAAFFKKNGYSICSTYKDCPGGHEGYVMYKNI